MSDEVIKIKSFLAGMNEYHKLSKRDVEQFVFPNSQLLDDRENKLLFKFYVSRNMIENIQHLEGPTFQYSAPFHFNKVRSFAMMNALVKLSKPVMQKVGDYAQMFCIIVEEDRND